MSAADSPEAIAVDVDEVADDDQAQPQPDEAGEPPADPPPPRVTHRAQHRGDLPNVRVRQHRPPIVSGRADPVPPLNSGFPHPFRGRGRGTRYARAPPAPCRVAGGGSPACECTGTPVDSRATRSVRVR